MKRMMAFLLVLCMMCSLLPLTALADEGSASAPTETAQTGTQQTPSESQPQQPGQTPPESQPQQPGQTPPESQPQEPGQTPPESQPQEPGQTPPEQQPQDAQQAPPEEQTTSDTVTVTFLSDDAVYATVSVAKDTALGEAMPADPTKEGYTFTGWTAHDAPFTGETAVTADTTATAGWTEKTAPANDILSSVSNILRPLAKARAAVKQFTVSFDYEDDDGSRANVKTEIVNEYAVISPLPVPPLKEGKAFDYYQIIQGADSFNSSSAKFRNSITVYGNYTLLAYYKADATTYTVTWVDENETTLATESFPINHAFTGDDLAGPTVTDALGMTHYWTSEPASIPDRATQDITYTLHREHQEVKFTLRYADNTKDTSGNPISGALTSPLPADQTVTEKTASCVLGTQAQTSPARDGYTFIGWNTDESAKVGLTSVNATATEAETEVTVTVYAIWEPNATATKFEVTLAVGVYTDGNPFPYMGEDWFPNPLSVAANSVLTNLPATVETDSYIEGLGYGAFTGWYYDRDENGFGTGQEYTNQPITEDTVLWAGFVPPETTEKYTLSAVLDAAGLTGVTITPASAQVAEGTPTDVTVTVPTAPEGQMYTISWTCTGAGTSVETYPQDEWKAKVTMGTEASTVTAHVALVGQPVTVTYRPGDGTGEAFTEESTYGSEVTLAGASAFTAPEGKEFDCWSDGTNSYDAGKEITLTENLLLTAQWKEATVPAVREITVKLVAVNGDFTDNVPDIILKENTTDSFRIPAVFPNNGNFEDAPTWTVEGLADGKTFAPTIGYLYTFAEFKDIADFDADGKATVTLTATFQAASNDVIVTFKAFAGEWDDFTVTYQKGDLLSLHMPEAPYVVGKTFDRWTYTGSGTIQENDKVNAPLTIIAHYTSLPSYLVTFDPNGGTLATDETGTRQVQQGSNLTIDIAPPTYSGHSFIGWNTKADGTGTPFEAGGTIENVTESMTLFAQWVEQVKITFKIVNGTWQNAAETDLTAYYVTLDKGTALAGKIPTPIADAGYHLSDNGWGQNNPTDAMATAAVTYTYTCEAFKIVYDKNGGEGDMDATYAEKGGATVAENGFTAPTGTEFKCWNTKADGSGTSLEAGATITLSDDLTLYAQWPLKTYTVIWDANKGKLDDGTEIREVTTVKHGTKLEEITPKNPKRAGYTFIGWKKVANTESTVIAALSSLFTETVEKEVTSDLRFQAQWQRNYHGKADPTNPKTGDNIMTAVTVLVLSAAALTLLLALGRKAPKPGKGKYSK